jgi:UDP-4-amino-4,6-dideoxy-N-acetyl-beta-L-altrosamine transaminase
VIPYGRQTISEADIESVVQVLRSDFLTQGPQVPAFEALVARSVDAPHAIAVNSATSALHMACLALDLGPGDWLWTSPNSFVASANCGLYCGAQVDFVDIDPRTFNMSAQALADKLAHAKREGRLPKVVIPVHFAGQSADMAAIASLAHEYDFKVIEDASHAIGSRWQGTHVGACLHSDITVFSFHPVKIITTAEGGLLTTRDAAIAQRLADLRSHGITREVARLECADQGGWYYEQQSLGYNYRMTELQAALGASQMAELGRFIARRHELVARYEDGFQGVPVVRPWQHPDSHSAFHLYVIQVAEGARLNRRQLFDALRGAGILVNVHYIPIHLQPFYLRMGFHAGDFPVAEAYYARAISLPLYAGLSEADQDFVIQKIKEFVL